MSAQTKTSWTPGPWTIELLPNCLPRVITPAKKIVFWLSAETYEQGDANLCLIAAAPELYEALTDLLTVPITPDRGMPEQEKTTIADLLRWRRTNFYHAALAKARGESA